MMNLMLETHAAGRKNPGRFKVPALLFFLLFVGIKGWAADEFQGLKCGADIPRFLIGKRSSNGPVSAVQERHKDLGLRDLGGSEISDDLFLMSWRICGNEYELLLNTKTELIRDVLLFPAHSSSSPQYIGSCRVDGKAIPGVMLAVLNNSAGYNARDTKLANTMLKATAAWTIDARKEKFAKYSTEKLECPLGGIITLDGGR